MYLSSKRADRMSLLAVAGLLWAFWPSPCLGSSEIPVTCVFAEVCMLPFQCIETSIESIHWYKDGALVHSFYLNTDQPNNQNAAYKNRTSVDKEQVAKGNAALILQRTNLQDRGKYRCYCTTGMGTHVSVTVVKVKAPVRSVDIKVLGEKVYCSSQNIYPKPHVSWATDPPTSSEALQASSVILPDSAGLFTLESQLGILGNLSDYTYTCSISLEGASQTWTASLKHQDIIEGKEGQALSIPCLAPSDLHNFTLTWAFMTTGQPTVFLNFNSWTGMVVNTWADQVRLDPTQAQSGNRSLQLLTSQGQEMNGTFICTFSSDHSRHVVYTRISITEPGNHGRVWLWPVPVAVIVLIIILASVFIIKRKSRGKKNTENQQNDAKERQALHPIP